MHVFNSDGSPSEVAGPRQDLRRLVNLDLGWGMITAQLAGRIVEGLQSRIPSTIAASILLPRPEGQSAHLNDL